MIRNYKSAIRDLNSLQSNAAAIENIKKNKLIHPSSSLLEMMEFSKKLDINMNNVKVFHVSGTKGKGSTCAFLESLLRLKHKTGLFTSPHLIKVSERIRINGIPVSENMFSHYFYQVWDGLGEPRPSYFKFLTLMAMMIFTKEVDVAVFEVGIGGTYDCTNIINPVVCGVSSLGLDHVHILGNSLAQIAWHKSGIFKKGIPAITVNQTDEAMNVLKERAIELQSPLFLASNLPENVKGLGIPGKHQSLNASLALSMYNAFCNSHISSEPGYRGMFPNQFLTEEILSCLKDTRWPGRCEIIKDNKNPLLTLYLDGAHTLESMESCVDWFASLNVTDNVVLVFYCASNRNPERLLEPLINFQKKNNIFKKVVFCRNIGTADSANMMVSGDKEIEFQSSLKNVWIKTFRGDFEAAEVECGANIDAVITNLRAKNNAGPINALFTGSLHLIGSVLKSVDEVNSP